MSEQSLAGEPRSAETEVPRREGLSATQLRIRSLAERSEGVPFRVGCILEIEGEVEPAEMTAALQRRFAELAPTVRGGGAAEEPTPLFTVADSSRLGLDAVRAVADRRLDRACLHQTEGGAGAEGFDVLWLRSGPERWTAALSLPGLAADRRGLRNLLDATVASWTDGAAGGGAGTLDYDKVAAWQWHLLESEETAEGRAFWSGRRKIAGSPGRLGAERWQPDRRTGLGRVGRELASAAGQGLEALARRTGADEGSVLLAAWQALLLRFAGQERDEFLVGLTCHGRRMEELEGVVGPCVRRAPMVARLSAGRGFDEVVADTSEQRGEVEDWQDYLDWRGIGESCGDDLNCLDYGFEPAGRLPRWETGGLRVAVARESAALDRFALELVVFESDGCPQVEIVYDRARFDGAFAERLLQGLEAILEDVESEPVRTVDRLPLMPDSERGRILDLLDRTGRELPDEPLAHRLIEAWAEEAPDAVALEQDGFEVTYGDLVRRSADLARHLRSLGVGPEVRVALLARRSTDAMGALLAVAMAGGSFVPLDPGYPEERLRFILGDAGAAVLLTDGSREVDGVAEDLPAVPIDDPSAWGTGTSGEAASEPVPESAAYVIYTSGSTGRPKGVVVSHRSLVNLALAQGRLFRLSPVSRVLQFSAFGFDAVISEIFVTLAAGATLLLSPSDGSRAGGALLRVLEKRRISHVTLPPPVLATVPQAPLQDLGVLVVAGEACPPDLITRWSAPGRLFLNAYGPAETTVCATAAECVADGAVPPIGLPIDNVRTVPVGANLDPMPVGVPGELLLGGEGVARGYLNRPGRTAEVFVPDPFGSEPGARIYRSGDLAVLREDDELSFLGRIDRQTKVHGVRVEPGEVEAGLRRHPEVAEAAVVASGEADARRLVAYVVPCGDASPEPADLRAHAREVLPPPLIPSEWMLLPQLPLTAHGKLDRDALPEPSGARSAAGGGRAARTTVERELCRIFAEVLGRDRVAVEGDFFDLGGHSLLGAQIVARIEDAYGIDLGIDMLFEHSTPAALAEVVDDLRAGADARDPIEVIPRHGHLPLSFQQHRLWSIDQIHPGTAAYNITLALELEGVLYPRSLVRALEGVARRHEVLRSGYPVKDGRPSVVIEPSATFRFPWIDLRSLPEDCRLTEARRLAVGERLRPFDLRSAPLQRVLFLRLAQDRHVLILTQHHMITDGWSLAVLQREVAALYRAHAEGRPSSLPELPVQYVDFAAWQRRRLTEDRREELLTHWRRRLEGAPPTLDLPLDRPRSSKPTFRGAGLEITVPDELTRRLRLFARAEGVTLYTVLLAAFYAVLARHAGTLDLVVGTPEAGRRRLVLEEIVGFFVNTLVLRTDLSGRPSGRTLLRRVHETVLDARAHSDLPFERLVDGLDVERDIGRSSLFQVLFALENLSREEISLPELEIRPIDFEASTARFELTLSLTDNGEQVFGTFLYRTDLFDRTTVARMKRHYSVQLERMLADPDLEIGAHPILGRGECQQVLVEWNDTAVPAAPNGGAPFGEAIRHWVDTIPDAVALVDGNRAVTFAELGRRSARLGSALRARGIGRGSIVALHLGRGMEAVIAMVGVHAAGAAWLALDPDHPPARRKLMVEDAGADLVLSRESSRGDLPGDAAQVAALESLCAESVEASPPAAGHHRDDLAYVIYTSGSTGAPKGVGLSQRGLASYASAHDRKFDLDSGDVVLQFASLSFDASVSEIVTGLYLGARLEIAPESGAAGAAGLSEFLAVRRVTWAIITPSLLATLGAPELPDLRTLLVAGEACSPELARRWSLGRRLVNAYGPTETTVCATWQDDLEVDRRVPIGGPIPRLRVQVVDAEMRPVPLGAAGELWVGGPSLARGYLGRPARTAESFVPDPRSQTGGERLYRTGDLVRWRTDASLDFLGRIDRQVKVRGFRVEIGEVEAALSALDPVRDAVVVARGGEGSSPRRLFAYVVPAEGREPESQELRKSLTARLPEYMVPAVFTVVDELPRTASGKVDRRALPEPEVPPGSRASRPPEPGDEQILANIWEEILGVEQVGADDNFFELGGDSILMIQIVSRAREEGLSIKPRQLFQRQTVAELAIVAGSLSESARDLRPVVGPVIPTPIQREFFARRLKNPSHWNQSLVLRSGGGLDRRLVSGVVEQLIQYHDALRLRSQPDSEEEAELRIEAPGGPRSFCRVDLSLLTEEESSNEVERGGPQVQRSLDLERGPVVRWIFFDFGVGRAGRHLVTVHHLAVDTVSWRILLEDFERVYLQLVDEEEVVLPVKTTSIQEWGERCLSLASSNVLRDELRYWRRQAERPVEKLPRDRESDVGPLAAGEAVVRWLDPEQTQALLRDLPRRVDARTDEILLGVLAAALASWSRSRSVAIDVESHGRRDDVFEDVDLSRTVGWFTTVHPLILDVDPDAAPEANVESVASQVREVPRSGFGFGVLGRMSDDAEHREVAAAVPEPEVAFNYFGQLRGRRSWGGMLAMALERPGPTRDQEADRDHLLVVSGRVGEDRLRLQCEFSPSVHDRETVDALLEDMLDRLRRLLGDLGEAEGEDDLLVDTDDEDLSKLLDEVSFGGGEGGN